jgi:ribosomal protein S18 acetylase RimI-like enzyme
MDAVQALLIRPGRDEDASALAVFAERSFRDAFGTQNHPADLDLYLTKAYGERQQSAELRDPQVTTLVAEIDRQLAGFAQLRTGRPPDYVRGSNPIELWRFYVGRPWHGLGVAQGLMRAALDAARAQGADTLWLGVWEHNPRAQAFYRKCGFVDVGQQGFLLGTDTQTDRVMAHTLA